MEIKENKLTGGFYAVIEKDKQYFLADLSYTLDRGAECMIFRSDKEGKVTDWEEVYAEYFDIVTKENLRSCVENFLEF